MTRALRICLLGATGTIGRATAQALERQGHDVVCLVRQRWQPTSSVPANFRVRVVDYGDVQSIVQHGMLREQFDAVISCMASRTGISADAWAVDYSAQLAALEAAKICQIPHFVLLSAICVQKPVLAFQHAKLAFENALIASGVRYSIVRPTAFFKSLSGQVERVRRGKPFLLFNDGQLTACKPISDRDLAEYLVGCLSDQKRWNMILPIGGPGPPVTPRQQGEMLFQLMGRAPLFRSIPVRLLDHLIVALSLGEKLFPPLRAKAELARIGRYYATESMLVLDQSTGRSDPAATPSTGSDSLFEHYRSLLSGADLPDRAEHAVF